LRATCSLPELYNSIQRVALLDADMGLIMSSEILKSTAPPFTTFAQCQPMKSKPIKKRVIAVRIVVFLMERMQWKEV
jgi:hypothetical protein